MQAVNPYLPNYEYIPDGEPYVFGDRLYVYGSHDAFNADLFCVNDYVCWSTPVDDLSAWRYEGVIYRKDQDPLWQPQNRMYAPDVVVGPDGRYYLYYTLDHTGTMAVAVGDSPVGPFEYYGRVKYADGRVLGEAWEDYFQFDPGVLVDDDGRVWLYTGFGSFSDNEDRAGDYVKGGYCIELDRDMLTIIAEPVCIIPKEPYAAGTQFESYPFFEASSIRKIGELYYLVYSPQPCHGLCYAISRYPNKDFTFGGQLVSNGDVGIDGISLESPRNQIGNNHGGMVQVKGQWYIFYHRQTNRHSFSRQGCAEPIYIQEDGFIPQAEMTSCGLNGKPLQGFGRYSSAIACQLFNLHSDGIRPYLTQTLPDTATEESQYIAGMTDGAAAGFKYFNLTDTTRITVYCKGATGTLRVYDRIGGTQLAAITLAGSEDYQAYSAPLVGGSAKSGLFFVLESAGEVDFSAFELQ